MKGMTGYSFKSFSSDNKINISCELKSFNHRFLDINISMASFLNPFEIKIRELIQKRVKRGKVDLSIFFRMEESMSSVAIDPKLAKEYFSSLATLKDLCDIDDEIKLYHLIKFRDIFKIEENRDYSIYWSFIEKLINEALDELVSMKEREGEHTKANLLSIIDDMKNKLEHIISSKEHIEKDILNSIKTKVSDLIGKNIDENRLLTEVALLVSRGSINEELERLSLYINEFINISSEDGEVGKKLDFLCQEMHREVNTTGNKIFDAKYVGSVISIKNSIEDLREQIRNIE